MLFSDFVNINEGLTKVADFYMAADTDIPNRVVAAWNWDGGDYVLDIKKSTKEGLFIMDLGLVMNKNKGYFRFKNASHIRPVIHTAMMALEASVPFLEPNFNALAISLPDKVSKSYLNLMKLLIQKTYLNQRYEFLPVDHKGNSSQFLLIIKKGKNPASIFKTKTFKEYDFSGDYTKATPVPTDALSSLVALKVTKKTIDITPSAKWEFKFKGHDIEDVHIKNIQHLVSDKEINVKVDLTVKADGTKKTPMPHLNNVMKTPPVKTKKQFSDHAKTTLTMIHYANESDKLLTAKMSKAMFVWFKKKQIQANGANMAGTFSNITKIMYSGDSTIRDEINDYIGDTANGTYDLFMLDYLSPADIVNVKKYASNYIFPKISDSIMVDKYSKYMLSAYNLIVSYTYTPPVITINDVVKQSQDHADNLFAFVQKKNESNGNLIVDMLARYFGPLYFNAKLEDIEHMFNDLMPNDIDIVNWIKTVSHTIKSNSGDDLKKMIKEKMTKIVSNNIMNEAVVGMKNNIDHWFFKMTETPPYGWKNANGMYATDVRFSILEAAKMYHHEILSKLVSSDGMVSDEDIGLPVAMPQNNQNSSNEHNPAFQDYKVYKDVSIDTGMSFDVHSSQAALSGIDDHLTGGSVSGYIDTNCAKSWMMTKEYKHVKQLSYSDIAAIKSYTGNSYVNMNRLLRKSFNAGSYSDEIKQNYHHVESDVKQLRKVFNECLPLSRGMWVFRNAHVKDLSPPNTTYELNQNIIDAGFISTSLDSSIFDSVAKNTKMMIYIPKGTRVIVALAMSSNKHEKEVILPPYSILRPYDIKVIARNGYCKQYVRCIYTGNAMNSALEKMFSGEKFMSEDEQVATFLKFLREQEELLDKHHEFGDYKDSKAIAQLIRNGILKVETE